MDLDQRFNRESGFRHPPIDPKTQIRLLRPLPSTLAYDSSSLDSAELSASRCQQNLQYEFEIVAVEDLSETSYRALSYTWGTASSTPEDSLFDIVVDGQKFWVRRNLYQFLVSLPRIDIAQLQRNGCSDDSSSSRSRPGDHDDGDGPGLIFIDAICIDQLCGREREAQVHLMREIYRRADGVISWLGLPPDEETQDAIQKLAAAVATRTDITKWTPVQRAGYHYLSHNRYWTRVWVLQEILLARSLVVACGELVFPLGLFASRRQDTDQMMGREWGRQTPAERVTTYRLRTILKPTSCTKDVLFGGSVVLPMEGMVSELRRQGSGAVWEMREYQTQLPDSLPDIMARYGHLECSDPRDKLYGLLGLLTEKSRKDICVDYGRGADFAVYQGLKVGLAELVREIEADLVVSSVCMTKEGRIKRDRKIDQYYRNISQSFRESVSGEEGERILQQVLDELHIKRWFDEVDSSLVLREHGYAGEIVSWTDFQKLCDVDGAVQRRIDKDGWLTRWHRLQYRAAKKVKRKLFARARDRGWEKSED